MTIQTDIDVNSEIQDLLLEMQNKRSTFEDSTKTALEDLERGIDQQEKDIQDMSNEFESILDEEIASLNQDE